MNLVLSYLKVIIYLSNPFNCFKILRKLFKVIIKSLLDTWQISIRYLANIYKISSKYLADIWQILIRYLEDILANIQRNIYQKYVANI